MWPTLGRCLEDKRSVLGSGGCSEYEVKYGMKPIATSKGGKVRLHTSD